MGGRRRWSARSPRTSGLKRPRQLMEAIYFGRIDEKRLAEVAPVLFEVAIDGDAIAREVVDRQADEVVSLAGTAIRRLRMQRLDVHVVLGGGIFRNGDHAFFDRIRAGLREVAPAAEVRVLKAPPVAGAAMMGLDRIGAPKRAQARVRRALTHERLGNTDSRPTEGAVSHGQDRPRWREQGVRQRRDRREQRLAGDRRRRVHGARRAVRVRQVHDPADPGRTRGGHRRRGHHRRHAGHRPPAEGAGRRDGVPELRALSAHDRRAEPRVRSPPPQDTEGRAEAARRRRRDDPGPRSARCSASRESSRVGSGNGWRWDGRWSGSPRRS